MVEKIKAEKVLVGGKIIVDSFTLDQHLIRYHECIEQLQNLYP